MPSKKLYDEYLEARKISDSIAEKRKLRRQVLLSSTIAIYIAIISLVFTQTSVLSRFFSFVKNDKDTSKILDMEKRLIDLEKENKKLEEIISKQNPQSLSYYGFNSRLSEVENSQKTLSDAVLLNPQEVITARLITEKQKILEGQFNTLENNFQKVNDNLNRLFWAAIILPLIGLIWSLIKDKIFKKPSDNQDIF